MSKAAAHLRSMAEEIWCTNSPTRPRLLAIASIAEGEAQDNPWKRWDEERPPKGEGMVIWAAPPVGNSRWSIGLAYLNVSGGWSDAYAGRSIGTHWKLIGDPPMD